MWSILWFVIFKEDDDKGNYKLFCFIVSYNVILSEEKYKKGFLES